MEADQEFSIVDWRVADGVLQDAAAHHWPVKVTRTATTYGGLSAIVQRGQNDDAPKTEVYLEREGDMLSVSIFHYDENGVVDDEPRVRLRIGMDGTTTIAL